MEDELFQVKNYFYLGNYQMAINEASQGGLSGDCKTELDCLVNRSYIGMGNFQVSSFLLSNEWHAAQVEAPIACAAGCRRNQRRLAHGPAGCPVIGRVPFGGYARDRCAHAAAHAAMQGFMT